MTDRPVLYGALDLGGTKVRALVADAEGRVYGEEIRLSHTEEGVEVVIDLMVGVLEAALGQAGAGVRELKAVGVASPGAVDVRRGVVPSAPQLPGWHEVPLREIMSRRLGLEVRLENDATAAALGEHSFGGGRDTQHMLYLTVSTGVGGGIIIDGKLYRGASGAAGELGHITVDPNGPPCGCGARGHLECLVSGTAIARRGEELVAQGESQVLAELREQDGAVTAEMMARAVEMGDVASREAYRQAGHHLGIALASLVNIFNPEVILIGGGVARSGGLFVEQARTTMRGLAMSQPLAAVRLDLAVLGDRAGPLGMVAVLREAAAEEDDGR